jgi:uncharacterized protein YkwD
MKNGLAWKLGLLAASWMVQAAWSDDIRPGVLFSSNPPQAAGFSLAPSQTANAKASAAASLSPTVVYSHGDPTVFEQFMLELVNRARSGPTAEAKRYGIDLNEGLPANKIDPAPKQPLAFNPNLTAAARFHSQWMLDTGQFGHAGTNGSTPGIRMQAAGYRFTGSWSWGENLAVQGTSDIPNVRDYVQVLHQGLFVDEGIDGRGHRLNLLEPNYREVGVGVQEGSFDFQGDILNSVMVTEDFGRSQATATAFLVGVVYRDQDQDGFYSPGEGISGITVMPDRGSYYAVTSTSGGYAIPISGLTGPLQVTFSGDLLGRPVNQTVALSGANVKLDLETSSIPPLDHAQPVLGIVQAPGEDKLELTIPGPIGATVIIEVSSDLKTWSVWQGIDLTTSPLSIAVPVLPDSAQQFYRAVLNPK